MLTTHQAADRLGINARSVSRLCRQGVIAATKHGRDYLITAEEVDRYATTRRPIGRPKKEN